MEIVAKAYQQMPEPEKLRQLYHTAFPKEEQLPWWIMAFWARRKRADLTAFYDGDTFCGFTCSVTKGNVLFIMFFAVDAQLRGKGYGSAILELLKKNNPEKTILLNVEPVDASAENYAQRVSRMAFYQKNGFYDTGYNIREVGGTFRVLSSRPQMDADAYVRVFQKVSYGFWKPKITKVQGKA